jgi:hypothetical protein
VTALCKTADILVITELQILPGVPVPDIQGMRSYVFPRPHASRVAGRPSGGVAVYVSHALSCAVTIWKSDALHGVNWLKFEAGSIAVMDVYLCACYVPPCYQRGKSNICDRHPLLVLCEDCMEAVQLGGVLLVGDLNAHTGADRDFVLMDESGRPEEGMLVGHASPPPLRANSDTAPCNDYGLKLLDMCKATGLIILNGRLNGDEVGECTFRNSTTCRSLLDYFVASPALLYGHDWSARGRIELHAWIDNRHPTDAPLAMVAATGGSMATSAQTVVARIAAPVVATIAKLIVWLVRDFLTIGHCHYCYQGLCHHRTAHP